MKDLYTNRHHIILNLFSMKFCVVFEEHTVHNILSFTAKDLRKVVSAGPILVDLSKAYGSLPHEL